MKLFSTLILFASLLFNGVAIAQNDTILPSEINQELVMDKSFKPDTLVDLNKHLGGLKDVTWAKETVIPEAIVITPEGLIILTADSLNADVYTFEVKATSREDEVYTISIKIRREGESLTTTIVSDKIDMATGFRKEGKIYVVIAVSLILFSVLVIYLMFLDRRMRKLNAKLENRSN